MAILYSSKFFSTPDSRKFICSSFTCCLPLKSFYLFTHVKNMSIWKLKILIFFSPDLNSIFLLKWSCKKILKLVKSLIDFVINGKQRWLLLFISLTSLNETFVQIDWPSISFQLFIKSITAKISNIFLV